MEEQEKIDQEDIFQINQIQKLFNENALNMGITQQKMFNLQKFLEQLNNDYEMLLKQNDNIKNSITNKYGIGSIDLQKGTFIKNK